MHEDVLMRLFAYSLEGDQSHWIICSISPKGISSIAGLIEAFLKHWGPRFRRYEDIVQDLASALWEEEAPLTPLKKDESILEEDLLVAKEDWVLALNATDSLSPTSTEQIYAQEQVCISKFKESSSENHRHEEYDIDLDFRDEVLLSFITKQQVWMPKIRMKNFCTLQSVMQPSYRVCHMMILFL